MGNVSRKLREQEFVELTRELLDSEPVRMMGRWKHHGPVTTLDHSLFVAFSTYRVARLLRMDVHAAVRGALLHDLYLYDSKDKSAHPGNQCFDHPRFAARNAAALTDAVMAELSGWSGTYCIESFHPGVLLRLKEKYPWVIRGQLSENFLRGGEVHGLSLPARFALTNLLTTGLTRPDFVAYRWQDRGNLSLRLMRGLYGVHEVGWTVRDQDTLDGLAEEEVPSIFEGFLPENS